MERISWKQVQREMRAKKIKDGIKDGFWKTVTFVEEHKAAIVVTSIVASNVAGIAIKAINAHEKVEDNRRRDNEIYDPSMKVWYDIKPMNNKEKVEFAERVNDGETRFDVLRDMKKLKGFK